MAKLKDDVLKDLVWRALVETDGDRAKAAEKIGCSRRTLDRHIKDLALYDDIDRMGWRLPGPPRMAGPKSSGVKLMVYDYIRAKKLAELGAIAVHIFTVDTPETRKRILEVLSGLLDENRITYSDGKWRLT